MEKKSSSLKSGVSLHKTISKRGSLIFLRKKMSTLYAGKFNWLQMLNQILQNSVGSHLIEFQVSMYCLTRSFLLVQTHASFSAWKVVMCSKKKKKCCCNIFHDTMGIFIVFKVIFAIFQVYLCVFCTIKLNELYIFQK